MIKQNSIFIPGLGAVCSYGIEGLEEIIPEEYKKYINDCNGLNIIEVKKDGLFHTGQSYDDDKAQTIYCKKCGGKDFNVGQGNYWTGIKCTKCGYEVCIHEG